MATPTRVASTTTQKLVVNWIALVIPENGYANINSYNLEWDAGTSGVVWYEQIGYTTDFLLVSFTVIQDVIVGNSYQFRIRAKNAIGWGPYSNTLTIKAATWPETGDVMITTIDSHTGGISINF